MIEALKKREKEYNVRIEFNVETEPLGTAGPLKLAEKILAKDGSPFFVLNPNIASRYSTKEHGDEGTIAVTKVEAPSSTVWLCTGPARYPA
jgi:mannose-1-phosphate guanylyltransferase